MRQLLMLGGIGLICASLLAVTRVWTEPYIEENRAIARNAIFIEMLGGDVTAEQLDQMMNCEGTRSALTVTTQGYSGEIEVAAIISRDGITMRTVRHLETPGIGDFIDGVWMRALDDRPLSSWQAVDNVTGATITTRAIRRLATQAQQQALEQCP